MNHAPAGYLLEDFLKNFEVGIRNFLHILLMELLSQGFDFHPLPAVGRGYRLHQRKELIKKGIGSKLKMLIETKIGVVSLLFIHMPVVFGLILTKKGLDLFGDYHSPKG